MSFSKANAERQQGERNIGSEPWLIKAKFLIKVLNHDWMETKLHTYLIFWLRR